MLPSLSKPEDVYSSVLGVPFFLKDLIPIEEVREYHCGCFA